MEVSVTPLSTKTKESGLDDWELCNWGLCNFSNPDSLGVKGRDWRTSADKDSCEEPGKAMESMLLKVLKWGWVS
jgi:hypothetical protein